MMWLGANWVTLLALLGSAGAGGVLSRLIARWLDHLRDKRKQTDDVAITLVQTLTNRIEHLEAGREADRRAAKLENELCETKLEGVRSEFGVLEGEFAMLLTTIKFAPDRAPEIIADVERQRSERKARETTRLGELRNVAQSRISTNRVIADDIAAAASG